MEIRANYRLVGIFIVCVSVVIVVTLLWLTNLDEARNKNFYTVYFRKHSLSGLQKDSYVTMKGVIVGSVVGFKISPRSVEEVKVTLRLEPETPVTVNTEATITRNLLTGLAAVELSGASDEDELLTPVSGDEPYPVIPEGRSTFDQLAGSIPELLENASSITSRVSALLSEENLSRIRVILSEAEATSAKASRSMDEVNSLLSEIASLSAELSKAAKSVSQLSKTSNKEIATIAAKLGNTLEQAEKTFAKLETQSTAVTTSLVNTSEVLSQQIVTVGQSVGDAADAVAHTAESFENPRAIITGPAQDSFGPGERSLP